MGRAADNCAAPPTASAGQYATSNGKPLLFGLPCKRRYSHAFPVAGPKTWNALPEDVTSSQSDNTFRRQLKTWLFKKSFPDIGTAS